MSPEEENVSSAVVIRQSQFESTAIAELAELAKQRKKFPIHGRDLEMPSQRFNEKKRKRLGGSSSSSSIPRIDRKRREDPESEGEVRIEVDGEDFYINQNFWNILFNYQQIGVKFLISKFTQNSGALIADEMGLGKSIQVVAFLSVLKSTGYLSTLPSILICPTTLINHWLDQFSQWAPDILVRECLPDQAENGVVPITSYEQFRARFYSTPSDQHFLVSILDEAQRIRNPDAQVTIAVKQINSYCRVGLSGSPIQNNLTELWSIFDYISPGRLGTLPTFQEELATPIEEGTRPRAGFDKIQLSYQCAVIVRDLTAPLMIRRLKSDHSESLNLSSKEEQILFCQLSPEQLTVYVNFLSTDTVRNLRTKEKGKAFYCISVLRKISNHPDLLLSSPTDVDDYGSPSRSGKLQVLIPLLNLWRSKNRRCLVFSQSLPMLDLLESTLNSLGLSWVRMDGSTSVDRRNQITNLFDDSISHEIEVDKPFCLLLSTRVGGVGLNLTGADRVVIFDPDWNPMTDAQARERSWRIGQKKDVKIFRLIASESIEEVIIKRQIYKNYLSEKILTDPHCHLSSASWDRLHDLFKSPPVSALKKTKSADTIISRFGSILAETPATLEQSGEDGVVSELRESLLTRIWNNDEIEVPRNEQNPHVPQPVISAKVRRIEEEYQNMDPSGLTWTGKHGGATALDRSKSTIRAIGSIRETIVDPEFMTEKKMREELIKFFKNQNKLESTTKKILEFFKFKIKEEFNEIFKKNLKEISNFDGKIWKLKNQFR
jgi:hypothetical protein